VGVNWAFRDLSPSIASPRNLLKCKNSQARRIVAYHLSKFVRSLSYLPLESLCRLNESRPLRGTQDATRIWRVK
jgi:hypothetical protein